VQVWVNTDEGQNVGKIAGALEKAMASSAGKELKAFIIFMNPKAEPEEALKKNLEKMAEEKKLEKVGLSYISGPKDPAVALYRVNADEKVRNTVFIYRNKRLESKLVNLVADKKGLADLDASIQSVLK
jgi:hypothetical protein